MPRTDLYIKVVVDYDEPDTPEKIAAEICRQVERVYAVRDAELSHYIKQGSD